MDRDTHLSVCDNGVSLGEVARWAGGPRLCNGGHLVYKWPTSWLIVLP